MKRITKWMTLILLGALLLLTCSCGQTEELSEAETISMTKELLEEGQKVFWWYYSFPDLQVDLEAPMVEGGYSPVGTFSTRQEMMDATEQVYTNRFCEKHLYPYPQGFEENAEGDAHFKEFDGRLYVNQAMGGMGGYRALTDQITVKSQAADEIVVTVVAEQPWEADTVKQIPYDFNLVKENGVWKLDNWYEYNSDQNFAEYRQDYLANPFFAGLLAHSWESADGLAPDGLVTYAAYEGGWSDTTGAEELEALILARFDVDAQHIRQSQYYDADANAYELPGLGGVTNCAVTSVEENPDYLLLRYKSYQDAMLVGSGLLRVVRDADGYQYHSNEFYARKAAPRDAVDSVIQSVSYDAQAGLFRVTIPEEVPQGYELVLDVSGWISIGADGREPFHAFREENGNFAWEPGKTYEYPLPQSKLIEIAVSAGLAEDGDPEVLNQIELYLYPDVRRAFVSEMQST